MILKKTLFILLEIIFFIIPTYSQDNLKITDKPLEVTILAIHNDLVLMKIGLYLRKHLKIRILN